MKKLVIYRPQHQRGIDDFNDGPEIELLISAEKPGSRPAF
jgi:hypothetical protein